ncbi:MAG: antitoxin component YwqK of YwqJK toxin-antitoxin module [Paraglaciecola sp.]|jgi:antitoxin component YwqK of YwqJK toxin-antitoxin module
MLNFRVSTLTYFALTFLWACGDGNMEVIENKNDAGVVIEKYTRKNDDFAKEGKYEAFFENGKVLETANYVNDVLDGERKIYREDGSVETVEHYENGQFSGLYQDLHSNGKVKFEGQYTDNTMGGLWKGYYESGALKEEVMMANNDENGPFKEYHENGKLASEGVYLNGAFEKGELKIYDENGELTNRKMCHLGICRDIWTKEGGDVELNMEEFKEFAEKMKAIQ